MGSVHKISSAEEWSQSPSVSTDESSQSPDTSDDETKISDIDASVRHTLITVDSEPAAKSATVSSKVQLEKTKADSSVCTGLQTGGPLLAFFKPHTRKEYNANLARDQ
jgi:hypothetical protein